MTIFHCKAQVFEQVFHSQLFTWGSANQTEEVKVERVRKTM